MATLTIKNNNRLTILAILLALPGAYFILVNVLHELGIPGPYNAIAPLVERAGGSEPLGWNINLLIAGGPVLAFFLTIFQVVKVEWQFTKEAGWIHFSFRRKWLPAWVASISAGVMTSLLLYLFLENCNC